MEYSHTQHAPLKYFLYGIAAPLFVAAWFARSEIAIAITLTIAACVLEILALAFHCLTVSDEGQRLSIRFGPLPLFRKSIAYSDMTHVEPGRSSIVDGWGIHYIPGRGWTYNLWGLRCAVVHLGEKTIRIGTDDVENLVEFLNRKIRPADV